MLKMDDADVDMLATLLISANKGNRDFTVEEDTFINRAFKNGWVRWGEGDCRGLQIADEATAIITPCCDPKHEVAKETSTLECPLCHKKIDVSKYPSNVAGGVDVECPHCAGMLDYVDDRFVYFANT